MKKLTIGDVSRISGYSVKQVRNLIESGVIATKKYGKGNHTEYPPLFLLALAYVRQLGWARPRAMNYDLIAKVVDFILDHTEEELKAEFEAGRTHLIPIAGYELKLLPWRYEDDGELFDLALLYDCLILSIEEDGEENRLAGRGRKTGLAASK
ncbi:hypothetical protein [Calycomorphotria hydatis]|uniref:Uncharacterized protein n=1 Tax=Calycomorphotria hydatis TaxID=2528027 RepID=A0A517TDC7_9PLAN|nr:hypothetical protein [Calycomorphotria hydatis]QDT66374.1 hypothetical protein V22_36400 [Calycomorphotria hydatis]